MAEIVRERQIDLVVPVFEEGFYLARYAELVPAPLFAPPFETIGRLHNKLRFQQLCHNLGLNTPTTIAATSRDELRDPHPHRPHPTHRSFPFTSTDWSLQRPVPANSQPGHANPTPA